MRNFITAVFLSAALAGAPSAQDALAPERQIEGVIRSQIDAFLEDDFARAFTFAAPNIQRLFGTSETFGDMVRRGYPMVWRPQTLRFGALREKVGVLHQMVVIESADGAIHYLDYRMERIDGAWRIAGVQILELPELAA
ncbi:DUF4864 domain-containing protein [Marivita sp. GX14005]|uniref:DUF4864 domain-containing protein n=1 Tax=Marivita sp. GX14005 TaxID=2942276 RepID=UPI002019DC34|nr:DUF4864 domain-containing protein [Marivita sp. GX14005]MCL3880960.1 DUF4864 domain-containing protein [Marivita sp. GX14005]